jgi:hypothetical protein
MLRKFLVRFFITVHLKKDYTLSDCVRINGNIVTLILLYQLAVCYHYICGYGRRLCRPIFTSS